MSNSLGSGRRQLIYESQSLEKHNFLVYIIYGAISAVFGGEKDIYQPVPRMGSGTKCFSIGDADN